MKNVRVNVVLGNRPLPNNMCPSVCVTERIKELSKNVLSIITVCRKY